MRKVSKEDEIQVRFLEQSSVTKRLNNFNTLSVSNETQEKVGKLILWLESQSNHIVDPKVIIDRIYEDIDYFMQKEIIPHSVCVKGCAYCCKIPVQVSLLEADYISRNANIAYTKLKDRRYVMQESVDSYCSFLNQKNGRCSIYAYRPLACRIFATIDHWKYCENAELNHYIHTYSSQPLFDYLHKFLMVHSEVAGYEHGVASVGEIRDWFSRV